MTLNGCSEDICLTTLTAYTRVLWWFALCSNVLELLCYQFCKKRTHTNLEKLCCKCFWDVRMLK